MRNLEKADTLLGDKRRGQRFLAPVEPPPYEPCTKATRNLGQENGHHPYTTRFPGPEGHPH